MFRSVGHKPKSENRKPNSQHSRNPSTNDAPSYSYSYRSQRNGVKIYGQKCNMSTGGGAVRPPSETVKTSYFKTNATKVNKNWTVLDFAHAKGHRRWVVFPLVWPRAWVWAWDWDWEWWWGGGGFPRNWHLYMTLVVFKSPAVWATHLLESRVLSLLHYLNSTAMAAPWATLIGSLGTGDQDPESYRSPSPSPVHANIPNLWLPLTRCNCKFTSRASIKYRITTCLMSICLARCQLQWAVQLSVPVSELQYFRPL